MTKRDIVNAVAAEAGVTAIQAKEIVQKTMDAIVTALLSERRIELRGFGVFEVRKRAARNPRTGETVFVPEKLVVTFKPSDEIEGRLQVQDQADSDTSEAA